VTDEKCLRKALALRLPSEDAVDLQDLSRNLTQLPILDPWLYKQFRNSQTITNTDNRSL